MTIWILFALLVGLGALLGYYLGAIRCAICLLGVVVAALLAKTLGGFLTPLVPLLGMKNPVWSIYVPPVLAFVLIYLVFFGLALLADHLINKTYRNKADEWGFLRWTRLLRRSGLALGAAVGAISLILIGLVIYVPGYLVTQFAGEDELPGGGLVGRLARDMQATGLDRTVARFDPAPPETYTAFDILGLVYHNPLLHSRLVNYPPFLGLAERPEVAALAGDAELNNLIQSRATVAEIRQHPKMQAVIQNNDVINELLGLNFDDLHEYLLTGVSPKFRDERILGRWRLNVRRSIAQMKDNTGEKFPTVELNLIRKALALYLQDMTLGFTTDNKAILKVQAKDEQKLVQTVGAAPPPPPPSAAEGGPPAPGGGLTARALVSRAIPQPDPAAEQMRQRYGLNPSSGSAASASGAVPLLSQTPAVVQRAPAKPPSTMLGPLMISGEGAWARDGQDYKLTFSKDDKELVLGAKVKEDQLVASVDGRTLVFDRL